MRQRHAHGTNRLLRDLIATGAMQQERPSAGERLESLIGVELTAVLRTSLTGTPGPAQRLQPRRAA